MHNQVDRQRCSGLVMQNSSVITKSSLTEENTESSKQGIILHTYPKYTTNLSVSTLSTQKELWEGEGEEAAYHLLKPRYAKLRV